MNRTLAGVKYRVLSTSVGKKLRKVKYRTYFTRENAIRDLTKFGKTPTEELISDMLKEASEHDVTFNEYLYYHFYEREETERREYIPLWEAVSRYIEEFNDYRTADLFFDKEKVYNKFKRFYKRKLMALHTYDQQERKEFLDFFRCAGRVIVKPYDGGEGRKIRIFEDSADAEAVFGTLKRDYRQGAVIEEVVAQDERMASLHPASLNTLKITTLRLDDELVVLPPFMRVGTNGSVVDNGGAGGILCKLDENGTVTDTADEKGQRFEYHPTTDKKLIGFQVPDLSEAVTLAKELASVYPEVRLIGWDIALSKDGYVMIEGNSAPSFVGYQLIDKGCRPYMDAMLNRFKEVKNK